MGEDPHRTLRAELGEEAATALAELGDADASHFAALVVAARRRERQALLDAAEDSLGFVPRFARGAIKKLVFG